MAYFGRVATYFGVRPLISVECGHPMRRTPGLLAGGGMMAGKEKRPGEQFLRGYLSVQHAMLARQTQFTLRGIGYVL